MALHSCFFEQFENLVTCSEDLKPLSTFTETDTYEILTEAGILPDSFEHLCVCSAHFSFYLRNNQNRKRRKLCEVPISLSSHPKIQNVPERGRKTKSITGGRPLDIVGVQKIREHWGIIIPVNTSICINCRRKLVDNIEEPKKFHEITADKVWAEAALQIFFSTGVGWGGLLTFASYNKFHDNVYRNAMIVPAVNCGTSIFAGFITFSMLGFMALNKGTTVDKVLNQGPGLVFITYPEAISSFPISPFWAVLFFLMLFTIGIDTQFGTMEAIVSALTDEFPKLFIRRKVLLTGGICLIEFIFGIPFVMQMVLVFNMTQITPVSYGTYQYPQWAIAAGWIIGMISVIPIPIHMVIDLWNANGTILQRLKQRSKPASNWRPENMDSTVYDKCVQKQEKFSPHFTTSSTENQTMF
ncbi:GLYT [Mytilus edulis]|uniref:SLC6A5_9 n=1 Tax=Mytilus edulis TaxID=6550 RepID=A0A8S3R3J6_MYTED|nr:GLYT [Mytilus edulis]